MGPAVHLALRAPHSREAYIFAKTPFSWFLIFGHGCSERSVPSMTGLPGWPTMEMHGGSSASYVASPCLALLLKRGRKRNRSAFRLPGEGWDHFHCAVTPSPGHSRCRKKTPQNREGKRETDFGCSREWSKLQAC